MTKKVVELGCGESRKFNSSITVDAVKLPGVDIVHDLNEGLPFSDDSIDEIHSYHFLEHVNDLQFVLTEIHRVLKKGGKNIGTVPHFSNPHFYSDFTHKNFFGLYTFAYFENAQTTFRRKVPTFYSGNLSFQTKKIDLVFKSSFIERYPIKKAIGAIFNSCRYMQELYEENFCFLFPAYEIYFEIEKI
ncbi:class I SAM-dependent methyltransferase [Sulfuricurvum sp.]|uniref:class I SAM-dependent methyltransferase n=1 Tax=Sulfuricurvum sp. TaxID=2025608 RepID=UPI002615301D|nr:class I SAM-dependent methyltransferase [Sulfuricurvum sp.]MDD4882945.1 class I SAM-dependent methyltransferase [Sulfuricurvum sp.]